MYTNKTSNRAEFSLKAASLGQNGPKLVHLQHAAFPSCPNGQAKLPKWDTLSCLLAMSC